MAIFADDLKRIAMSAELAQTLSRAADYAHAQSHDQIQLEHLLLALTEDPDAAVVLSASHVDAGLLKADVSQYLGGLTERISPSGAALAIAPDLRRILEAAAAAASHGRRRDINGAIVLAAIVGDGKSPSAHMLRVQGLTFEEAIRALQQTIAAPAAAPPPAAVPASDVRPLPGPAATEDLLAAARARINQSRGAQGSFPQAAPARSEVPGLAERLSGPSAAPTPLPQYDDETGSHGREQGWPPEAPASHGAQYEAGDEGAAGHSPLEGYAPEDPFPHADPPWAAGTRVDVRAEAGARSTGVDRSYQEAPAEVRQPSLQPTASPRSASRLPPSNPALGSRWPAPVAPAWRDAEQPERGGSGRDGVEPAPIPPPLPGAAPTVHDGPQRSFDTGYGGDHRQEGWVAPTAYAADLGPDARHLAEPHFTDGYGFERPGGELSPSFEAPADELVPYRADYDPAHQGMALPSPYPAAPQIPAPPTRGKRGRKLNETAVRVLGEALPRRMRVHVPTMIEAKLAKSEIRALAAGLGGGQGQAGRAAGAQSGVAMSVRLRAPDGGLMIDPASSETQWFAAQSEVIESELAQWQWTVTPLWAGRERLQIVAAVRGTGADGGVADYMLPEIVAEVRVKRRFGRLLLGLAKWVAVAGCGAGIAIYGPPLLNPVISAVIRLWK